MGNLIKFCIECGTWTNQIEVKPNKFKCLGCKKTSHIFNPIFNSEELQKIKNRLTKKLVEE